MSVTDPESEALRRRPDQECLTNDAGRAILAELEALRRLAEATREWWDSPADSEREDIAVLAVKVALAAVDAARKGESK